MAEDAITLIVDDATALPLAAGTHVLVTGVGTQDQLDVVVGALLEHGLVATGLVEPAPEQAAEAATGTDAVLVLTSSSGFTTPADQLELVEALAAAGTPVIHASLRNPYDVVHVGPVAASLAAYGNADCSLRAVAGAVAGTVRLRGRLPVAIPTADGTGEAYPLGHGLR